MYSDCTSFVFISIQVSDLCQVFLAVVSIQTQWKELGIALGIYEDELKKIDTQEFGTSRSLYEVLKQWIECTFGSWEKLVKAVSSEKVDQKELAKIIEKKHIGKNQYCIATCACMQVSSPP